MMDKKLVVIYFEATSGPTCLLQADLKSEAPADPKLKI